MDFRSLNNTLLAAAAEQCLSAHRETLLADPVTAKKVGAVQDTTAALHDWLSLTPAERLVTTSTREIDQADRLHDTLVTAFVLGAEAAEQVYLAHEPPRNEEASRLMTAARTVLPAWRQTVRLPYLTEGMEARINLNNLLQPQRAALKAVAVADTDLLVLAERYAAAGDHLKALLNVRAGAEAEGTLSADGLSLRRALLSALNALFGALPHSDLSEETQARVLAPFYDAIADEQRRDAASKATTTAPTS